MFTYTRINGDLIESLSNSMEDKEICLLLGSRHAGKRTVLVDVEKRLVERNSVPVVRVNFGEHGPLWGPAQLHEIVSAGVSRVCEGAHHDFDPGMDILAPVRRVQEHLGTHIALLAGNVDSMSDALARRFLQSLRTLTEQRRVAAILTGESRFMEIADLGPTSELNISYRYVLQGLDLPEFGTRFERETRCLVIPFVDSKAAIAELWKLTGGNAALLRTALWTIALSCSQKGSACDQHIETGDIAKYLPRLVEVANGPGADSADLYRSILHVVRKNSTAVEQLEQLKADKTLHIPLGPDGDNPPSLLELAGVAVRDGQLLEFASPLIKEFVGQNFGARCLGDIYARMGRMNEALARYRQLSREELRRPLGIDDREDVEAVVSTLAATMHSSAARGVTDIESLFVGGCRWILGFDHVLFFRRDANGWKSEPILENDDRHGLTPGEDRRSELAAYLNNTAQRKIGPIPLPDTWSSHALASLLPEVNVANQRLVLIGDVKDPSNSILSGERRACARLLLDHFVQAMVYATSIQADRDRLNMREKQVGIIDDVVGALGGRVRDARGAIKMATDGLRGLAYRRVLVSLIDPRGERIEGAYASSDDPTFDIKSATDWPLTPAGADVQPAVVSWKAPVVVADATTHPLCNPDVVKAAGIKAFAVVPMINPVEEVIGTLHVEREDGAAPGQDEINDLMFFGRQLAVAVQITERMNLLESALDSSHDPVLIVGPDGFLRYANGAATDLFGTPRGFHYRARRVALPATGAEAVSVHVLSALNGGNLAVHHFEGGGIQRNYRGEMLTTPIRDWRNEIVGAMAHVRDLDDIYKAMEAVEEIAEAKDISGAIDAILRVARKLGRQWVRLYLTEDGNPKVLVSRGSFSDPPTPWQEAFNHRKVQFVRNSINEGETFLCLIRKEPILFCCLPNQGATVVTPNGIEAVNIREPHCPEEFAKREGDYWLDFPLLVAGVPMGKLTLGCDENVRPDWFALLRVLCQMASGLLVAFQRRDEAFRQRALWVRQASEKAMGQAAHDIVTRLGFLGPLRQQYVRLAEGCPDANTAAKLRDLNDRLKDRSQAALDTVREIKEKLIVRRETGSIQALTPIVQQSLKAVPGSQTQIACDRASIEAWVAPRLLDSALSELVENSRVMHEGFGELSVRVEISPIVVGGTDWIRIAYSDNGPGVPPELKERIFEDGYWSRHGGTPGTGLGLGYVRRIAEAHGGRVWEEGVHGAGARFVLEWPRLGPSLSGEGG